MMSISKTGRSLANHKKILLRSSNPRNKHDVFTKNSIQLTFDFDFKIRRGKGRLKTWLAILGVPLKVTYDEKNKDFKIYVNKSDTIKGGSINRIPFLKAMEGKAYNRRNYGYRYIF